MRVVILGCGRTGSAIAASLGSDGDRVAVIDRDPKQFSRLPQAMVDGGAIRTVPGEGTLSEIFGRAEMEDADIFIAVTGQDTVNALAAQKVKQLYDIGQVIVRVRDPSLSELYSSLGLSVYCPTEAAVSHIVESISREG